MRKGCSWRVGAPRVSGVMGPDTEPLHLDAAPGGEIVDHDRSNLVRTSRFLLASQAGTVGGKTTELPGHVIDELRDTPRGWVEHRRRSLVLRLAGTISGPSGTGQVQRAGRVPPGQPRVPGCKLSNG